MQINFTKVLVLGFSRKATSGTVKLSAAMTKPVAERMGWGRMIEENGKSYFQLDVPDWQKSSNPVGKLAASQIDLEPKDPQLSKHAIVLDGVTSVDSFEIVRTEAKGAKAKKTKAYKTELLMSVNFTDIAGAKKLEAYMQTANSGDSSMIVTYEREPENEELPGMETDTKQGELETIVEDTRKKRAAKDVN